MSGGYGAPPTRPRGLRPRTVQPPLPDVPADQVAQEADDYRWDLYEEEMRQDRLLEHSGLNRMAPVASSNVVVFPVRDETARAA